MTNMLPNDLEMLAGIPDLNQYTQPAQEQERQDMPPAPPAPQPNEGIVYPQPPAPAPQEQPQPNPYAPPIQAQPQQPAAPQYAPQPQQQNGPSDWQQEVAAYARQQREMLERQNQQQYAPQQPEQWVDPAFRPENQARLADLYQRLAYDENAQREFNQLQADMTAERVQHQTAQQFAAMQQQMQLMYAAPTVTQNAFAEVQGQYGQALTRDNWDAVLRETFGDNPQAIAQALDTRHNPQAQGIRNLLADAAAYRGIRMGQVSQAQQPMPRAMPPAQVQSAARNPAPSRAPNDWWADPNYMQSVMDRAYDNPFQFLANNNGGQ